MSAVDDWARATGADERNNSEQHISNLLAVGLLFFNETPERFFPGVQIDVVWFPEKGWAVTASRKRSSRARWRG